MKKGLFLIGFILFGSAMICMTQSNSFIPQELSFEHIMLDSKGNPVVRLSYNGIKSNMVLQFDSAGNFIKQRPDLEGLAGGPSFLDDNGNFWAVQSSGEIEKIYKLDKDNNKSMLAEIKNFTRYFVTRKGTFYFLRALDKQAEVYRYNFDERKENKLFTITDLKNNNDPDGCAAEDSEPEIFFVVDSTESTIAVMITRKHIAEIRTYSSKGELILKWIVTPDPFTPDSYINGMYIDSSDLLYIINSSRSTRDRRTALRQGSSMIVWEIDDTIDTSWLKGSIAQYDLKGKFYLRIKDHIDIPGAMAADKRGYLYVIMLPRAGINVYDRKGNYLFRWNAEPPYKGENWVERKNIEDQIISINDNTPTDLLIQAMSYGDEQTQSNALQFLVKREPSALLLIMDALKKQPKFDDPISYPGSKLNAQMSLVFAAEQIANRNGEKALSLLKEAFLKEDEQSQQQLAGLMARLTGTQLPVVTQLINRADREQNGQANVGMDYVPMQEETVKYFLNQLSDTELANKNLRAISWHLPEHINDSFPALKAILLDPNHPLRDKARGLLIGGTYLKRPPCDDLIVESAFLKGIITIFRRPYSISGREIPQSIKELQSMVTSNDFFVRDTVVMALGLNGFPGYEKEMLESAERTPSFLQPAMYAIASALENNPERIKQVIPQILNLIDKAVYALYPLDKESQKKLTTKQGKQAAREAWFANRNFRKMVRNAVRLNSSEINMRLLHYVGEPDLPDDGKIAILEALNVSSLKDLAPDTIKLLDLPLAPLVLKQIVQNLSTYKAIEASAKLIELYEKNKAKQNFALYEKFQQEQYLDAPKEYSQSQLEIMYVSMLQLEIINAFGAFKEKANLAFLINAYNDVSDCGFRLAIMKSIAGIGSNETAVPFLQSLLENEHIRLYASVALAKMGDKSILPVLIEGVLSNFEASEYITPEVFEPLKETGTAELIKLLDVPFEPISAQVALTLAQMKVKETKNKILNLYKNCRSGYVTYEYKFMDALLLYGEDPFPEYFKKHELNLERPIGSLLGGLEQKTLAVQILSRYLKPGSNPSDALNAINCLGTIDTPEAYTVLKNYTPPADARIKEALSNSLLCSMRGSNF